MADSQQPGEEQQPSSFSFRKKEIAPELQQKNWQAIEMAIAGLPVRGARNRWLRPALVTTVLLGALIGTVVWLAQQKPQPAMTELATRFGEIKRVTLPDGSLVVLNANSKMRLPQNWTNPTPHHPPRSGLSEAAQPSTACREAQSILASSTRY